MAKEAWLSPMNRILFQKAFEKRKTSVKIRGSREFNLDYKEDGIVKVTPKVGFAPMGKFSLKRVLDEMWITEQARADNPPGLYLRYLDDLIESDLEGVEADTYYPNLMERETATVRAGFANAKTQRGKRAEHVKVVVDAGHVYLIKEPEPNADI